MKISRTSHPLELRASRLWVLGDSHEIWGSVKGRELLAELKESQLLQQDCCV